MESLNEPAALARFVGPPRSVVWRGGGVHLRSRGRSNDGPDLHAHFGIQLTFGMDHEVSFRAARHAPKRLSEGWLGGSGQPHWIQGVGVCVTAFLDPFSAFGRCTAARLGDSGALALSPDECKAARRELEDCWARGWSGVDLQAVADRIVVLLTPAALIPRNIDPRVQAVLDDLILDSSANTSLHDMAAKVGLSESRLAHLFRRDVGLAMRQYRLSLRLHEAVAHISSGRSLTESAHMAGFADSAQFSRICRRMFGSAPSNLPDFTIEETRPGCLTSRYKTSKICG